MSVDLSDPAITGTRRDLLDPSSGTSWFLLHYNPSTTTPALSVVASGHDPVVQQWKEHLKRLQESRETVIFGYGEFEGKGCILLYLHDSVAGVKRARAVVHSRAVAQLFPDYSALITISNLEELTDSLINERLGLDYYHQRSLPVNNSATSGTSARTDAAPAPVSKDATADLPPAMILGETLPSVSNPTPALPAPQSVTSTPAASTQPHVATPNHTIPTIHQPRIVTPIQNHQESSLQQNRQVSGTHETLPETPADRQRKTSLTARLGKAFGNPAMQHRPEDYSSDGSPTSASGSSRIKSSFSKAFRRTPEATSPQHSPKTDTRDGPPVPPKDGYPSRPTAQNGESSTSGTYRTPSGGMGYAPPIVYVAPKEAAPSNSTGSFPEAVSKLYPARKEDSHLSPSPSAKRIMTEARIKSVTQEQEIQNRFRRDLHLDETGTGEREEVDDLDDDVRLPYDTSDHSVTDHLDSAGGEEPTNDPVRASTTMQIPRKPIDFELGETDGNEIEGVTASQSVLGPAIPPANDARELDGANVHDSRSGYNTDGPGFDTTPMVTGVEEDLSARLRDEQRQKAEGDSQLVGPEAEAETPRQQSADALAQEVEDQRLREQEEELRLEAEDRQRADAAAELQRHAEEYALQKEAERLREREEEERREAEARRLQDELERQRKDEEEEKLRLALEEQHRMDQIRLAEEEARRQEEEKKRIEAEKQEAERARKEGISQALRNGKLRGGVMLRGHVTVQTLKSPTWRRRSFRLLSGEMQLYKNEADETPIQTIPLGHGVSIEHTYEESQVQGSWKIVSGQETFFVFADSPEEKETILEGLSIAIV